MSQFSISQIQSLCKKYGLTPSRRYGQNFLVSPEPIETMMAAAELSENDTVVEVGPGFGVLTFALAKKAKKVVAFEIEKKLKPYWEEKMKELKNVEMVWGNVLKQFPISNFSRRERDPAVAGQFSNNFQFPISNYKVVSNIPYQITSNIIRKFLESENPPETMVLMTQKEVAERICAKPGEMSLLSVSVQYYAEPEIIMMVPRSCFWPEPEVDSAVVKLRITNYELRIENGDKDDFFRIVKAGFSKRRKLLIKNLLPLVGKSNPPSFASGELRRTSKEKLKDIFNDLGLSPLARAQELSVEQWRKLAQSLVNN